MAKLYPTRFLLKICLAVLLSTAFAGYALALPGRPDSAKVAYKAKITDTRKDKPVFLKTNLRMAVVPFKPAPIRTSQAATPSPAKTGNPGDKVLTNVKVYPNPVGEQLNVSFHVSKDVLMSIKIMDFLGNEVGTLSNQRFGAGEQNASFNIGSRFNSGLYFLRFIAGNETVIKRISIL